MDSLLTNLADELLVQDITQPSVILGSLSNHKPRSVCLGSPHRHSRKFRGADRKLVIGGNRANIHLMQAAFYAVKLERR